MSCYIGIAAPGLTYDTNPDESVPDIEQQIQIVDDMIAAKVDAIVIAPGDSQRLVPVLKRALDSGIKVVNLDNRLDPAAVARAGLAPIPFISVDNEQAAYGAAKFLAADIGHPTEAAIIEGIRSADNARQHLAGATRAFAENHAITLVVAESANWKIDEGYAVAKQLFARHPNVKLIFAANDMMGFGVVFDPRQLLQEVALLFRQFVDAKGLTLDSVWSGPADVRYWGDPLRLRQMLTNLVSNAAKFTAHGGIHIAGAEIRRKDDDVVLEFSVSDTGIGIAQDKSDAGHGWLPGDRGDRAWELERDRPRVPIIALTAGAFREDRDKCIAAGMDDFLVKPLRLADLEAMLTKWTAGNTGVG